MAHPIKSQYDLLTERLEKNKQIRTLDTETTQRIRKEIGAEMDKYYFEKRHKVAQSERHAVDVI